MDSSLDEKTKKALYKLLTDSADVFSTSDDDLKYPTTLMTCILIHVITNLKGMRNTSSTYQMVR